MAEAIHDVERHGFNKFIKFIVAEIQRGDNRFNPGHKLIFNAIHLWRHKAERHQRQIVLLEETPAHPYV